VNHQGHQVSRRPTFVSFVVMIHASLEFGGDKEFLRRIIVLHAQNVRFAADLAILDIALAASGGLIDGSGIPFAAGGALEPRFHEESLAVIVIERLQHGCARDLRGNLWEVC